MIIVHTLFSSDCGPSNLPRSYITSENPALWTAFMYLREFAQDLMYRLRNKDIYFRGILTQGKFTHYLLEGIPCF